LRRMRDTAPADYRGFSPVGARGSALHLGRSPEIKAPSPESAEPDGVFFITDHLRDLARARLAVAQKTRWFRQVGPAFRNC